MPMRLLITLAFTALFASAAPVAIRSGCDSGDSVIATVPETTPMRVNSALAGDSVCYSITVNASGHELEGYTVDPMLPAVVEFENERRAAFRKASIIRPRPDAPTPDLAAPAAPPVRFPNFEAVDLQGKRVNLSSLRGKVVLVTFWSPSHPKTLATVTRLRGLYTEFHEQGLDAVGVAIASKQAMAAALVDVEFDWPQVNDEAGLARALHVPNNEGRTYVLDANRNIVASNLNGPELTSLVMKLLRDSKSR